MSGLVDVLAVMVAAANALNHTRTAPERISLLEAMFAVAGLVKAAEFARKTLHEVLTDGHPTTEEVIALNELTDALDNAGAAP